ncbi:Sec1 family domain-containing protein MIP3 [Linum perenne]
MAALVDVTKSCLDSIRQMGEHLEDAIIYLDSGCTESFQYAGAFPVLLDLGVRAVCSLENMSSLDAVVNWNSNNDVARKIVVFTSRFLSDAHRYILRCLSTQENVHNCTIYTSISETSHSVYHDSPLGPDAYREYESLLLQDFEELVKNCGKKADSSKDVKFQQSLSFEKEGWAQLTFNEEDASHLDASSSGRENDILGPKLVVSVHHFPMLLCPLSRRVFVLPSEGSVVEASLSAENEDSLSPGLPAISTGVPADSEDVPPGALLTAHFLYHLAAKMDLKLEIFSMGDLSKTVGKIMTDMSSLYDVGRRKRSAGLLIIDRTLDLLTPCFHADSLVDRMFSALPRRERVSQSNVKDSQSQLKLRSSSLLRAPLDVKIPLAEILSEEIKECQLLERIESFMNGWDTQKSSLGVSQLLNGSFVSTESFLGTALMEAILDRRTKDGALLVKRWLQETLHREKISLDSNSRSGFASSEVQTMVKALTKTQSSLVRNKGIILLAAAAMAAFEASFSARWEAFISAEKILNASAEDTSQNLAAQIVDLVNKSGLIDGGMESSSQGLLSFEDALLLMVAGYMLAGENFPTSGSGGPFSWQEEHFMKEAVVEVILEKAPVSKLKFLHGLKEALTRKKVSKDSVESSEDHQIDLDELDEDDQWGKWGDEEEEAATDKNNKDQLYDDMQLKLELRDKVDSFFKFLHKLSTVRRKSVPLKDASFSGGSSFGEMDSYKGLLYKVLSRVLSKSDVPGMEYHSSTVGRLFKSSFGRFVGQAKPSLGDQNVVMVFVVGGINAVEVLELQEALSESERPDVELILGGTTILTPDDMFDLLIGESSYL